MALIPAIEVVPPVLFVTTIASDTFRYTLQKQSNFINITSIPSVRLTMARTPTSVTMQFRVNDLTPVTFETSSSLPNPRFSSPINIFPYTFKVTNLTARTVLFSISKDIFESQERIGSIIYNFIAAISSNGVNVNPVVVSNASPNYSPTGITLYVIQVGNGETIPIP